MKMYLLVVSYQVFKIIINNNGINNANEEDTFFSFALASCM